MSNTLFPLFRIIASCFRRVAHWLSEAVQCCLPKQSEERRRRQGTCAQACANGALCCLRGSPTHRSLASTGSGSGWGGDTPLPPSRLRQPRLRAGSGDGASSKLVRFNLEVRVLCDDHKNCEYIVLLAGANCVPPPFRQSSSPLLPPPLRAAAGDYDDIDDDGSSTTVGGHCWGSLELIPISFEDD